MSDRGVGRESGDGSSHRSKERRPCSAHLGQGLNLGRWRGSELLVSVGRGGKSLIPTREALPCVGAERHNAPAGHRPYVLWPLERGVRMLGEERVSRWGTLGWGVGTEGVERGRGFAVRDAVFSHTRTRIGLVLFCCCRVLRWSTEGEVCAVCLCAGDSLCGSSLGQIPCQGRGWER